MKRLLIVGVVCLTLFIGLGGCGLFKSEIQRELDDAMALWETAGYSDYTFELQVSCFCPQEVVQPVIVVVVDGNPVSVVYRDLPQPVTRELFADADTIPEMFDLIQSAIDEGADSLVVEYHPQLGYPVSVSIDWITQAVDEEIAYFVKGLAPAA